MSSYIERVLEFLERQLNNKDFKPQLLEDIEWAIDTIGKNKLNTHVGNLEEDFDERRPEIKAWIDIIRLRSIPRNIEEINRLQELEESEKKKKNKKGNKRHVDHHDEEKRGLLGASDKQMRDMSK